MGQVHIDVSPTNDNIKTYLRMHSFFDKETNQRLISKKDVSCREIEQNVEGHKKSSISTKLSKYKQEGLLVESGDMYIVQEPQGSFISLDEKFCRQLIKTFNSDTNNIYFWLYRRFNYLKSKGRKCYFTKGQLATEALGKTDQTKNREKVESCLTQLCLNGLIGYRIVRYKQTFLRELLYIRTKMVVVDAVDSMVQKLTGDSELDVKSLNSHYDDISNDVTIIAQFGYDLEKLNQLEEGANILCLP